MRKSFRWMLCLVVVGLTAGCAYLPKKSGVENRDAINHIQDSGDREALEKYFKENSYKPSGSTEPALNMAQEGDGGREENYRWSDLSARFDQAVKAKKKKEQADLLAQQNRDLLQKAMAGRAAEQDQHAAEIQEKSEARHRICGSAGLDFVISANILILKKMAPGTYWVQAMGLSPYGNWLCYDKAKADQVKYTPCGQGRSCAIVQGLPEPIQARSCGTVYLRYAGTQQVQNTDGFDGTVAAWKVVSNSTLKSKFQIDSEKEHLDLRSCNNF